MIKKFFCMILAAAILCVTLSSCGYRLALEKVEKNTTDENPTAYREHPSTEPPTRYIPGATEPVTEEATTITSEGVFNKLNISYQDILALYTHAVDDVKAAKPGFSRNAKQTTGNVVAGNGNTQLANGILNLVGQSILNGQDSTGYSQVQKGDASGVREQFPLYGSDSGCTLLSTECIESAECYTNGREYLVFIALKDCLNPDENSDFAKIADPVDVSKIKEGIPQYFVVLDYSQYQFDINYTNCGIVCVIDRQTSRITSLTKTMTMDVSININLDLVVFQTDAVKCSGTITDEVYFTDFRW